MSPIVASRRLRGATSGYVVENGSGLGLVLPVARRVAREAQHICCFLSASSGCMFLISYGDTYAVELQIDATCGVYLLAARSSTGDLGNAWRAALVHRTVATISMRTRPSRRDSGAVLDPSGRVELRLGEQGTGDAKPDDLDQWIAKHHASHAEGH